MRAPSVTGRCLEITFYAAGRACRCIVSSGIALSCSISQSILRNLLNWRNFGLGFERGNYSAPVIHELATFRQELCS